ALPILSPLALDAGAAPGVQRRMGVRPETRGARGEQRLEVRLDVVEIHAAPGAAPLLRPGVAAGDTAHAQRLQVLPAGPLEEAAPDLEQAHPRLPPARV